MLFRCLCEDCFQSQGVVPSTVERVLSFLGHVLGIGAQNVEFGSLRCPFLARASDGCLHRGGEVLALPGHEGSQPQLIDTRLPHPELGFCLLGFLLVFCQC